MTVEVFAEDFFRCDGIIVHQQRRSQRLADREEPIFRFVVF